MLIVIGLKLISIWYERLGELLNFSYQAAKLMFLIAMVNNNEQFVVIWIFERDVW